MRIRQRRVPGDRGAVLVIVAVFALVATVFLAFVVDIGNQRQDRRQLTTATDASALDVAQEWIEDGELASNYFPAGVCTSRARVYLDENRAVEPGAYSCRVEQPSGAQWASVSVFANGTTPYEFGPAIGINEGSIGSTTSVRLTPRLGGGLRPFAVCANDSLELITWLNNPTEGEPYTDVIVGGPKALPVGCGTNNGNWGFVAFDDANGLNGMRDRLASGTTQETYSIDRSPNPTDPEAECKDAYYSGRPDACLLRLAGAAGWSPATTDIFQKLKDDKVIFNLPVYDDVVDLGGGKTGFPIKGFLEARLLSFCGDSAYTVKAQLQVTLGACRNQSGQQVDNFVHLELRGIRAGDCCDINPDNVEPEICDVGTVGGQVNVSTFGQNCQTGGGFSGPPPFFPPPPPPSCGVSEITFADNPSRFRSGPNVDELRKPLDVTATLTNFSLCGVIDLRVLDPSSAVKTDFQSQFPGATHREMESETFSKPWGAGTYTLEVLQDGNFLDSVSFTL